MTPNATQKRGQNLTGATILAPDTAFGVSDLVSAADSLSFASDTAEDAPLGDQLFRVRNLDGEATFTLSALPPLPVIGVRPLPLALPQDGSLRQIIVTLSRADAVDRAIALEIADPAVAELQTTSVTFLPEKPRHWPDFGASPAASPT